MMARKEGAHLSNAGSPTLHEARHRPRTVCRALLIEHDPHWAGLVGRCLQSDGWFVEYAEDGVEAMELLTQQAFALVVMELQVPGVNGWELLRYMRGDWELGVRLSTQATRVVAMSCRPEPEVSRFACRLGADVVLTKPFREETLTNAIAKLAPSLKAVTRSNEGIALRL